MAVDVKQALTRKIGPLPAWGWGVALGGGILAFRFIRGGSIGGGGAKDDQQAAAPTFVNPAQTSLGEQQSQFISGLSGMLDALPDQIAQAIKDAQKETISPPYADIRPMPYSPPITTPLPTAPQAPVSSPTPAPAASTPPNVYAVQKGDTLDSIAAKFGIAGGGDRLYSLNWWLASNNIGRNASDFDQHDIKLSLWN